MAVSTLSSHLHHLISQLPSAPILQKHPSILRTALTAISLPLVYYTYLDYTAWLAVGKGGLPHNILGYIVQAILTPLRASRFDTSFLSKPRILKKSGPEGEKSWLSREDVPKRKGVRPGIYKYILPQRQIDQHAGQVSRNAYETLIHSIQASHPSTLLVKTSILERAGLALYINPRVSKHPGAYGTRNEIAHIHTTDGSMHVSLAPKDAALVIEQGWGERFGVSGSLLPVTYTMIYAPRPGEGEEEEIRVVEGIIRAGVRFMLGEEFEEE